MAVLLALLGTAAAPPSATADEMTLRATEGQRYRAMVQGNLEVLAAFLDDDLVYTHSHGGVDDKESFLESVRSGAVAYRKIQLGSSHVEWWGNAAVVTGVAVLEVAVAAREQIVTQPVRFTAVYRRGPDLRWRLLAWQTTPTADANVRPLEETARQREEREEAAPGTAAEAGVEAPEDAETAAPDSPLEPGDDDPSLASPPARG